MRFCMTWQGVRFDWTRARAFLVTAEEGSFSAAARALGLTQPTLGRQVAALEEELGVALFDRVGRTLALSPAGRDLLAHVRRMGEAAESLSLAAAGRSETVEGRVSVTASDAAAAWLLPPALARLRRLAPGLTVEVVASNGFADLRRREADVALRHARPTEPDLIARRLGDSRARIYAATALLERVGRPADVAALSAMDFVGAPPLARMIAGLAPMGVRLSEASFPLLSESGVAMWEMVRRGLGAGVMMEEIAALTPEVEEVLPGLPPIPVPVWLVTHRELRESRRIRLVFDVMAETLGPP